jgi:plastocyanin
VAHSVTIRGTGIEPEDLTAKRGETVVWSNATSWTEALILFEKGKGISQACADPVGFFRPAGGDYTSGLIGPGQEASLCIAEPGTYEYRVQQHRSGRSYQYSGRIVVR